MSTRFNRTLPFFLRCICMIGAYGIFTTSLHAQHSFHQVQLKTDGQDQVKFIKLHAQDKKFNLLLSPDTLYTALAQNWEISGTIRADVEGRISYSEKGGQGVWEFSLGQQALFATQDTQELYLWYLYANQDTLALKSFIQDSYAFYYSSLVSLKHTMLNSAYAPKNEPLLISTPLIEYSQQGRNKAKFLAVEASTSNGLTTIQQVASAFLCLISHYRLTH